MIISFLIVSLAIAVQPFAIPSKSRVTIRWSTSQVNTGCDGNRIDKYTIMYKPVGSTNTSRVTVEAEKIAIVNISDVIPSTEYQYTVVAIDPTGKNATSDIKHFITQNNRKSQH